MAKRTCYLLSDIAKNCPESEDSAAVDPLRSTPLVIYPSLRPRRKIGVVRKRLLDSISDYLYYRAQKAETAEDRDAFTLALAIIGAVRREDSHPFESACYEAFGSTLEKYRQRRAEWQWARHAELMACVPDFDPAEGKNVRSQLLVMAPARLARPHPETACAPAAHNPANRHLLGDGGKESDRGKSIPTLPRTRSVSGRIPASG